MWVAEQPNSVVVKNINNSLVHCSSSLYNWNKINVNENLHDQSTDTRNAPQINHIIEFNNYELSPTMIVDDDVVELYQMEEPRTRNRGLTMIKIWPQSASWWWTPMELSTLKDCWKCCLTLGQQKHSSTVDACHNTATIAGNGMSKEMVVLWDMHLPEFDKSRQIHQQKALVFDHDCWYKSI